MTMLSALIPAFASKSPLPGATASVVADEGAFASLLEASAAGPTLQDASPAAEREMPQSTSDPEALLLTPAPAAAQAAAPLPSIQRAPVAPSLLSGASVPPLTENAAARETLDLAPGAKPASEPSGLASSLFLTEPGTETYGALPVQGESFPVATPRVSADRIETSPRGQETLLPEVAERPSAVVDPAPLLMSRDGAPVAPVGTSDALLDVTPEAAVSKPLPGTVTADAGEPAPRTAERPADSAIQASVPRPLAFDILPTPSDTPPPGQAIPSQPTLGVTSGAPATETIDAPPADPAARSEAPLARTLGEAAQIGAAGEPRMSEEGEPRPLASRDAALIQEARAEGAAGDREAARSAKEDLTSTVKPGSREPNDARPHSFAAPEAPARMDVALDAAPHSAAPVAGERAQPAVNGSVVAMAPATHVPASQGSIGESLAILSRIENARQARSRPHVPLEGGLERVRSAGLSSVPLTLGERILMGAGPNASRPEAPLAQPDGDRSSVNPSGTARAEPVSLRAALSFVSVGHGVREAFQSVTPPAASPNEPLLASASISASGAHAEEVEKPVLPRSGRPAPESAPVLPMENAAPIGASTVIAEAPVSAEGRMDAAPTHARDLSLPGLIGAEIVREVTEFQRAHGETHLSVALDEVLEGATLELQMRGRAVSAEIHVPDERSQALLVEGEAELRRDLERRGVEVDAIRIRRADMASDPLAEASNLRSFGALHGELFRPGERAGERTGDERHSPSGGGEERQDRQDEPDKNEHHEPFYYYQNS